MTTMIQLYSDKYGYADLGTSDITINLDSPYQHFFEEPEDFSYSFEVPMTQNNISFFGDNSNLIDIVVDNYKVLQRFRPKILEKSLSTMTVSIFKTRLNELCNGTSQLLSSRDLIEHWQISSGSRGPSSISGNPNTGGNNSDNVSNSRDRYKEREQSGTPYGGLNFRPLADTDPHYEVYCELRRVNTLWSPIYTYANKGDWIYGEGKFGEKVWPNSKFWTRDLRDISQKSIPYRFLELRIPHKAFLSYLLGYIPDGYNDEDFVIIPIDLKKFKLEGIIDVNMVGYGAFHRPTQISYIPKHNKEACFYSNPDEIRERYIPFEGSKKDGDTYNTFPFSATRSDIVLSDVDLYKSLSTFYVENSGFNIIPIQDIEQGDLLDGANIQNHNSSHILINVSGEYDLTSNKVLYNLLLDVPAIIEQYYESFAKELPVMCNYDNIPETLFNDSVFSVKSDSILSYKEKEILEEEWSIKRFGYEDFWAPYQYTSNRGQEVIMTCTDINLIFIFRYTDTEGNITENKYEIPYSIGLTGYCNVIGTKFEYDEDNVSLHPLRMDGESKKPLSLTTMLFWKNYIQGDTNEVEIEVIGYNFANTVHIGDRYFAVDSVETSDFKTYKLKLIEWKYE